MAPKPVIRTGPLRENYGLARDASQPIKARDFAQVAIANNKGTLFTAVTTVTSVSIISSPLHQITYYVSFFFHSRGWYLSLNIVYEIYILAE